MAVAALSLAVAGCGSRKAKTLPAYDEGINIIPLPKELVQKNDGAFEMNGSTSIIADGDEANTIAEFFGSKMRKSTGYSLKISKGNAAQSNALLLKIDPSLQMNDEGYTLHSDKKSVQITGKTAHGLFYGMQTLLQLLPAEIESPKTISTVPWNIPAVEIKDEPAFRYRGMMLDVCRHFLSVEDVKRQIDIMAMFKINYFHWHLTEDQAWRIEIKKYPKLTEVGSKRIEGDGTEYGGFYTQEQIKDVVKYASDRFITVVPEIELPGHAMAALSAYPELACFPRDFKPRIIWGVEQDVYCAGKESVFEFLENVIDEVAPLFPGKYFHIGGDECPKDRWKVCPLCQKRMKENGLKNEHELQSYFVQRIEKVVEKHGKKMIGWDEILEGGLAPSAIVMSWTGEEGGIKAAKMDHEVIMTPGGGGLYIDHYQGDPKIEPVGIGGYDLLEKTYGYYPIPKELPEDKHKYVLGSQCNVWSEYLYQPEIMEYRAYPREIALSEAVWTPKDKKDFKDFCRRINNAYVRLDMHEVNYHIPLPEQPNGSCDYVAFTDSTKLTLQTTRPIKIVYTTDGSDPKPESQVYESPIPVSQSTTFKVASVLPSGKMSTIRTIEVVKETPSEATPVENAKPGLITNTTYGEYQEAADLSKATSWNKGEIKSLDQLIGETIKNSIDEVKRKAVVAEGFINIPADGVYYFSTNNNEFWIDGEKLIDNAGEVKKYSRKDKSRALKAGLHPIKVVWVGAIYGGWPTYWNSGDVETRAEKDKEFKKVAADMLFHQ